MPSDFDQPQIKADHLNILANSAMLIAKPKNGGLEQVFWVQGVGCWGDVVRGRVIWMIKPFEENTGFYGIFSGWPSDPRLNAGIPYQVYAVEDAEGYLVFPEDCPYWFYEVSPAMWHNIKTEWPKRIWGECPTDR